MINFFIDGLGCFRHPNPIKMKLGSVINKDQSVDEFFSCPKCFQLIPATKELKEKLERVLKMIEDEKKAVQKEEAAKLEVPPAAVTTELVQDAK